MINMLRAERWFNSSFFGEPHLFSFFDADYLVARNQQKALPAEVAEVANQSNRC